MLLGATVMLMMRPVLSKASWKVYRPTSAIRHCRVRWVVKRRGRDKYKVESGVRDMI